MHLQSSKLQLYHTIRFLQKQSLCSTVSSDERKKFDLQMTLQQFKILNHYVREYLKHEKLKDWNVAFQKFVDLIERKEMTTNEPKKDKSQEIQVEKKDDEENIESSINKTLFGAFKSKSNMKLPAEVVIPKWRTDRSEISKGRLISKTKHLLILLDTVESVQSRLKRIEDLTDHLSKYPDAKLVAVKEGAIQKLLRIRSRTRDYATNRILRECFALLGYIDPLPNKGIRILSIDGGGIRGLAVLNILEKLEELTGKRIYELFDYICGVSTGSILVSCIGTPQGITLEEARTMYTEFGTKLFTQSAFWGVSNLVWSRAYYDTTMFEQLLKRFVGETPLVKTNRDANCPKLASVSTVVNQTRIMPFVFRNYSLPCNRQSQYLGSCHYSLWEAVRASGAAPTIFQEFTLDGMVHQDGGILVNNPCAVAIHEAKLLWPDNEIQCVISCGTGRHAPLSVSATSNPAASPSSITWKGLFNKILESATDTEAVHTMLNDLLPGNVYFRFNPYLTDIVPMHEIRAEKISQMQEETMMYIRKNEEKFIDASNTLLIKKTLKQKVQDVLDVKAYELGVRSIPCKL